MTTPNPLPTEIPLLIVTGPRKQSSGYDLGMLVNRLYRREKMTVEQIAEKICQSPQWVRQHLKLYREVNEQLSKFTFWELYRWMKTPPVPLRDLFPSSGASPTIAELPDALPPDASPSETPAT